MYKVHLHSMHKELPSKTHVHIHTHIHTIKKTNSPTYKWGIFLICARTKQRVYKRRNTNGKETVKEILNILSRPENANKNYCKISFYNRNRKKNNGCLGPGVKGRLTANEQGEFFK